MKSHTTGVHILPVRDLTRHRFAFDCWCGPEVETLTWLRPLIIHNASDGRELIEQHGLQ